MNSKNPKNPGPNKEQSNEAALIADIINANKKKYTYKDNILNKISRGFFNKYLIGKLNEILKLSGCILYFQKFPQIFVMNVIKKKNQGIWNMTPTQIFKNKEFYGTNTKKNYELNYEINLKVIENEKIQNNEKIKSVLNLKLCDLYDKYLASSEYEGEIQRLKNKNYDNNYISKFMHFAYSFIKH